MLRHCSSSTSEASRVASSNISSSSQRVVLQREANARVTVAGHRITWEKPHTMQSQLVCGLARDKNASKHATSQAGNPASDAESIEEQIAFLPQRRRTRKIRTQRTQTSVRCGVGQGGVLASHSTVSGGGHCGGRAGEDQGKAHRARQDHVQTRWQSLWLCAKRRAVGCETPSLCLISSSWPKKLGPRRLASTARELESLRLLADAKAQLWMSTGSALEAAHVEVDLVNDELRRDRSKPALHFRFPVLRRCRALRQTDTSTPQRHRGSGAGCTSASRRQAISGVARPGLQTPSQRR